MDYNEIKLALESCLSNGGCSKCPAFDTKYESCVTYMLHSTLEFIIKQNDEQIKLKKRLSFAEGCINEIDDALYRGSKNDYAERAVESYNNFLKELEKNNG